MLTGKELYVLKEILSVCGERESCLISEEKLLSALKKKKLSKNSLDMAINSLQAEGYFEVIRCQRDKSKVFCFFPKIKARCYERERKQLANSLIVKIIFAVLGSVSAFIATQILYGLF